MKFKPDVHGAWSRRSRAAAPLMSLLAAGLLAACGGGGGDGGDGLPSGPVTLAGKADVLRELANASAASQAAGVAPDLRRARTVPSSFPARERIKTLAETSTPPPTEAQPCGVSGTREFSSGERTRDFAYFNITAVPVSFVVSAANRCVEEEQEDGVLRRFESDGRSESGGSSTDEAGDSFGYVDESGSFRLTETQLGAVSYRYTESFDGSVESRFNAGSFDLRLIQEGEITETVGTSARNLRYSIGETGSPFRFISNQGGVSLDGVLTYTSTASGCRGGRVELATAAEQPLTYDASGSYPNGGTLTVSAGSGSVTVTYNLDGSASYQIAGGESGELTLEELDSAESEVCVEL